MTVVLDRHRAVVCEGDAARSAGYYRDVLGWPAVVDGGCGDVRLRLGSVVDALFIRAGFASEVNNVLVRHMFRTPVIVVPGEPAEWIFLTGPRTTLRQSVWDELVRMQVGWKRRGETIVLPAPDDVAGGVRWRDCLPKHRELPRWTAVVGAARSASSVLCGGW